MSGASALVPAPNSLRTLASYFPLGLPDCCSVIFLMCFFGCCLQLGGGWSDKKRRLSFFFSSVTGSFVIGGPSCIIAINPSSQLPNLTALQHFQVCELWPLLQRWFEPWVDPGKVIYVYSNLNRAVEICTCLELWLQPNFPLASWVVTAQEWRNRTNVDHEQLDV